MPTIVDSLIVTLGLDPKKYNEGRKKVSEDQRRLKNETKQTADEMEARGAQAAQFFTQIKREAVGLFATLVGARGIDQFVERTVTSLSAMNRQAKITGLSVRDMYAFGSMIERNGGNADAARASLQGLAEEMERFKVTGQSAMLPALNKIGASRGQSALEVYERFATWAKGKDPRLVNYEGRMLGLDEASINKAMQGVGAVRAGMAESYRLGVPSDDQVQKVTALQQSFLRLRQAIVGDANALLGDLSPAMVATLDLVDRAVERFPLLSKAVLGLVTVLTALGAVKIGVGVLKLLGLIGGRVAGGAAASAAGGAVAGGIALPATAAVGGALWATGGDIPGVLGRGGGTADEQRRRFTATPLGRAAMWLYHKVGGKDDASAPAGGGGSIAADPYSFFRAHGASEATARGIAAGIMAEGGKIGAKNPHSTAYGIGQWLKGRQGDFKRVMGKDIHGSSMTEQLQFMMWELTHSEAGAGLKIRNAATPEAAMTAYIRDFMRPGGGTHGDLLRGARALGYSGASARAFADQGGGAGPNEVNVRIDRITVETQASDAKGIAGGIGGALRSTLATQGSQGLVG